MIPDGIASIFIPSSMIKIEKCLFAKCDRLTHIPPLSSCAIAYAKKNEIPYREI